MCMLMFVFIYFFFVKQKTAYEMLISYWSSDVCSSDLLSGRAGTILVVATAEPTSLTDAYAFIKVTLSNDPAADIRVVINSADTKGDGQRTYETLRKACATFLKAEPPLAGIIRRDRKIGRASCRERECQYV